MVMDGTIPPHFGGDLSVSVVVPVYNSENTLAELVERLASALSLCGCRLEVILVNDGSQDRSWQRICELCDLHDYVRGIDLMRNYGQHNALLCGIWKARHEVIVTMDDDLQHPPEEVPKLLRRLAEGHDVVYGVPEERQDSLWRDMASRLIRLVLQGAVGVRHGGDVSAFRAFRCFVREAFADCREPFVALDVLLTWATTRFSVVRVHHERRRVGVSNYNLGMLVGHAFTVITSFSVRPLQLASLIGFLFTALGLVLLVFVLARYVILGRTVPGLPFLTALIAVFSGVQLFTLGIVGEYLARVHLRTMGRPSFVIRQTAGFSSASDEECL